MTDIFDQIAILRAKNFDNASALSFYNKIGIGFLFQEYMDDKKYMPSEIDQLGIGLKHLLQNGQVFRLFFIEERPKELILAMLGSNDENMFAILADTLHKNGDALYGHLMQMTAEGNQQELNDLLDCLFFLLEETAAEDGTTMIKLFREFAGRKDSDKLLNQDAFTRKLSAVLSSDNTISRCRAFDLVIALCDNPLLSEAYHDQKIIQKCIAMYKGNDDLLEKLNLIELLKQFSSNKHALLAIKELDLLAQFRTEIFDPSVDMYIKRDLSVVVLDVFNNFVLDPDFQLIKAVYAKAKEFMSGYNEHINAGLEITLNLFVAVENTEMITQDREFFAVLKQIQRSNDSLRHKLFEYICSMLTMRRVSYASKSSTRLPDDLFIHLFILVFGDQYVKGDQLEDCRILEALEGLIKQLNTPFDDIEYPHLKIFDHLVGYDRLFMKIFELPYVDKLILYMNNTSSKNQKVNAIKKDLKRKFQDKIQVMRAQDPGFKALLDKFVAELEGEKQDEAPEVNATFGT